MRRLFVLALCVSPGCDSNAPVVPERVVAFAGDGQAFVAGGALPFPLTARVIGSDNRPLPNVMVTWTVTLGAATVGTDSAETDAFGLASTRVTLGNQVEPVAVRAAAFGLPPVTFTAAACGASPITAPDTITDSLVTADCKSSGFYTDFYSLDLTSGQQTLTIFDSSSTFDTYLDLYRSNGEFVAFNDDVDPGVIQHSRIHATLAPGTYVLAANSFDPDTTGGYVLSVVGRAQALANCDVVWATLGVSVMDSVTTADCVEAGPYYADFVAIFAYAGSVLEIAERSTAFDAALFLQDAAGDPVASNNDSVSGVTDAYLVYTVPQTGPYGLFVATRDVNETGAYTLDISAPAVSSPGPSAGRAVAAPAGPWRVPLRAPKAGAWQVPLPWVGRSR